MQSPDYDIRLPRLYVEAPLHEDANVALTLEQTHYLKTVMRRPEDAELRVFNGRDGEWIGTLTYMGKKEGHVALTRQIRPNVPRSLRLHLIFAPIKKDRMDFMIEKAVELGVTDLHPVLTQFTTIRDLNAERVQRQIVEAAEQSERLDLPTLHKLVSFKDLTQNWVAEIPVFAAIERSEAPFIGDIGATPERSGLFIGPEGGIAPEEKALLLQTPWIKPVTLGSQILRAETAAIFGLSALLVSSS